MSLGVRQELLYDLEKREKSRALVLFLGDRVPVSTILNSDAVPILNEHLESFGHPEHIALILYTRGGNTLVPLRLVNLIREHCRRFSVWVPMKAHSAGTMICLGADEVYMAPLGELSPIDPSVGSPFNPVGDKKKPLEIGIEDVVGYLTLAQELSGLSDQDQKAQIFLKLAECIHPIALGSIYRTYLGIRSLANELLRTRRRGALDELTQSKLVDNLTARLYFHERPISRKEAKSIGMTFVRKSEPNLDDLLTRIGRSYARDLKLDSPFAPEDYEPSLPATVAVTGAIVESTALCHSFVYSGSIQRIQRPPASVPTGADVPLYEVNWSKRRWQPSEQENLTI